MSHVYLLPSLSYIYAPHSANIYTLSLLFMFHVLPIYTLTLLKNSTLTSETLHSIRILISASVCMITVCTKESFHRTLCGMGNSQNIVHHLLWAPANKLDRVSGGRCFVECLVLPKEFICLPIYNCMAPGYMEELKVNFSSTAGLLVTAQLKGRTPRGRN